MRLLLDDIVPQRKLSPIRNISPPRSAAILRSGSSRCSPACRKAERAYTAPIVPLYLCYAITHIVPMTVGFGNFFALKLFRRRIYQDHYESPADPSVAAGQGEDDRMTVRGIPAPQLYSPERVLGGPGAALRRRTRRTGGGVRLRHARVLQSGDPPGAAARARAVAEGRRGNPRAGCRLRRRTLEPAARRARRPA